MENMVMTEEMGMDELLAQSGGPQQGEVTNATVVSQSETHLLVNVGLKQEASIPLGEFSGNIPAVGSEIPVLVLRVSGPEGRPIASWKQARERKNWSSIQAIFEKKEPIEGKISRRIKGGVTVDIGLDAFMPASQMDLKPVGQPEKWVGRSVKVLILEMDAAKGNVLVSRRRLLEIEREQKRSVTLEALKPGQVVKGRVTGLTNFGAFVDIGGIEGLLHVSDLDWARIDNPAKVLKVDQELDVQVLKYDASTHRISLGRKQLLPHPWDGIEQKFPIGTSIKGKVTGIAPFGIFVQIEPGVEGLVHVSELSWTERIQPQNAAKQGQEVEAKVIGIDRAKEKISLSLKRVGANPWEQAAMLYPVGSQIEGDITNIANFGIFVRIPVGVEALIKSSDVTWAENAGNLKDSFKVGDKVKAVVLDINVKEERMALGLKQLSADPMAPLKVGKDVKGQVVKVTDGGLTVKLENGIMATVRANEIQARKSRFKDDFAAAEPEVEYKVGDEVHATIIKSNRKDRKVELSIRKYDKEQERELLKKYSGNKSNPTLGEAMGWTSDEE